MRALRRVRWLLAATAIPFAFLAAGLGIQAAVFDRPPQDALIVATAIREMLRFHVMRATEVIAGGRPVGSTCIQGWFRSQNRVRPEPGSLVLLSDGVRLYDFGKGIHRVGRRGRLAKTDLARFLLAGCPRFMGDHLALRLVRSRSVDSDLSHADSIPTYAFQYGPNTRLIELFVEQRTFRPVALRLSGYPRGGWSDLRPGGDRAVVNGVRRAFHLPVRMTHSA